MKKVIVTLSLVFLSLVLYPSTSFAVVQSINGLSAQNQLLATTTDATTMHMQIATVGADTNRFQWDGTPWSVAQGGTGATSFSNGSILFVDGGIFSSNNSQLSWDTTSNALNIGGTISPAAKLSVKGSGSLLLLNLASSSGTSVFSVDSTGSTTIANGVNITDGCYAVGGTCLTIPSVPAQKSKKTQTFTSSGMWIKPASVSEVWVTVVGGGGGGGGGNNHNSGGGAGGYSYASTTVSGNVAVTIGSGGTGANPGGNSSFAGDITIIATGGGAGSTRDSFSGPAPGGAGGTTTNANIISITGQSGQKAGSHNQWCMIGSGGSSPFGFGGLAPYVGNQIGFSAFDGVTATGYGGGGSGACVNGAAGSGSSGIVFVEWWE